MTEGNGTIIVKQGGREVWGSECLMKEKLSKVKSGVRDSGFDHRGLELGWMG
ncbi:hypothetical protein BS17DRAFT_791193 [Gyrodon lividus]|nr:hypothetical protein BS17DRAFT_791193 [Gyrodon lividus]